MYAPWYERYLHFRDDRFCTPHVEGKTDGGDPDIANYAAASVTAQAEDNERCSPAAALAGTKESQTSGSRRTYILFVLLSTDLELNKKIDNYEDKKLRNIKEGFHICWNDIVRGNKEFTFEKGCPVLFTLGEEAWKE